MKLALQLRPLSGGNARQGEADDGFGGACPKSTPPFTLEALLSRCTAPLGLLDYLPAEVLLARSIG